MNWQEIIYPALSSIVVLFVSLLLKTLQDYLKRNVSTLKYAQAFGVIFDVVSAVWTRKVGPKVQLAMADGKVTDEEWADLRKEIMAEAKQIAIEHLSELRGFAPKNIAQWVEVQVDRVLGELIGRALNGAVSEDALANTPASDPSEPDSTPEASGK